MSEPPSSGRENWPERGRSGRELLRLMAAAGSDGVPVFALFVAATILMISLQAALTPLLTSGAPDEVGHVAGTAASTIRVISLLGSALLSPLVSRAIGLTVTPFAVGFLVFSVVATLSAGWANKKGALVRTG